MKSKFCYYIITSNQFNADQQADVLVTLYTCTQETYHRLSSLMVFFYSVCEATGTAATPGLLCQPRVIVKMIVEKQTECRMAGETEVLGENLPQRHSCTSQNLTWSDPVLNPGRRGGKPATNRLSYGAAPHWCYHDSYQSLQVNAGLILQMEYGCPFSYSLFNHPSLIKNCFIYLLFLTTSTFQKVKTTWCTVACWLIKKNWKGCGKVVVAYFEVLSRN
jgi:hypothetical protein